MGDDVYEVSTEIEPDGADDFPADCAGAFVYCYVVARSLREAIDVAERVLREEGCRVIDVDHAVRIDLETYEPHDDDHPSRADLARVLAADDCEFGPFDCYEIRDEDDSEVP